MDGYKDIARTIVSRLEIIDTGRRRGFAAAKGMDDPTER
jgi:hypothetical protein